MADPSLWERFQALRTENQAAVQAANKPNLMGVRPAAAANYQNAPGENLKALGQGIAGAAQGFIDNRRTAIQARQNPAPPPAAPALRPPAPGATTAPSPVPAAPPATPPANQGYQSLGDSLMVRTQGGATDYRTPQGSMTFQGGAMGFSGRQGGGTLSVMGNRTPDEQAGIDQRVANINRQTEALRQFNVDTGRSATPRSDAAVAPARPVDPFARAGDGFGDSGLRAARYEGLLRDAGSQRGFGGRRRSAAMLGAAEGMLAPGLGAAQLQGQQQASRDSLLGQLTQADAAQAQADQRAQEAGAKLGLEAQKANQAYALDAIKTFQGMGQAQQQQAKADLFDAYAKAANEGDQATMTRLQPLMDYLYPQRANDPLAAMLQQPPK